MSPNQLFATTFASVVAGFCGGWLLSLFFRAGMLMWVCRIRDTLLDHARRIDRMTTTNNQFASDLSDLASAVVDIGTAIDVEAANFQAQIDALKASAGNPPTPEQLASLEGSIANLKTISAKAKSTGTPASAPVTTTDTPPASA